ncbi:MAG: pentapeptide repeat-containing protein [Cyanobacteria bacterium P01_G01_bin.39]
MNYKFFIPLSLTLAAVLTTTASRAQIPETSNEIYKLCSKFPKNSRCKGIEVPISLKERSGEKVSCNFIFDPGQFKQVGACKITVEEQGITIYQEQGDKIELIEDQRATTEIKIPRDRIFITNYQLWNKIHRWEIGWMPEESSQKQNKTNFMVVLLNEDLAESLTPQITSLSTSKPEMLAEISASVDSPTSTPESGSDGRVIRLTTDRSPSSQSPLHRPKKNVPEVTSSNMTLLLATKVCQYCDLSNVDLSGVDLKGANLVGANLQGANLKGANLEAAYLLGANLQDADLTNAQFKGVNLTFGTLNRATLINTKLEAANLQQADISQTDLTGADLSAPCFLEGANLEQANLTGANLRGANLEQANLKQANLVGANLSRTDVKLKNIPNNYSFGERLGDLLIGFPIFGLSSGGVDFKTKLDGANLEGADLRASDLKKVDFGKANLTNVNFTEAKLDEETLESATLCGVTLADGSQSDRDCPE